MYEMSNNIKFEVDGLLTHYVNAMFKQMLDSKKPFEIIDLQNIKSSVM
jgi:hypothetical protein